MAKRPPPQNQVVPPVLGPGDAPLHFPDLKFGAGGGDDEVSGHGEPEASP